MKEATGELNLTVITVIAIAAVGALVYAFVLPVIGRSIANNTCKSLGDGYSAKSDKTGTCEDEAATVMGKTYYCCK